MEKLKTKARAPLGTTCESTTTPGADNTVVARKVVRFALQEAARDLSPSSRVVCCLRRRVVATNPVDVWYAPPRESAYYGNLQTCGLVWVCPICAAKISEQRRVELSEGVARWRARGNEVLMVSFMLSHHLSEPCWVVLDGLLHAHSAFWRGKGADAIRRNFDVVGRVRGLEATVGENGWHNHLHGLLFLGPVVSAALRAEPEKVLGDFEARASARWLHVLDRGGRSATVEHGFDVRWAMDDGMARLAADYIAKTDDGWTVAHEVAKSHVKLARGKAGRSPNGLLADYLVGDEAAGSLWQEYVGAFRGQWQVRWSKGLRKELSLGAEVSDRVLAITDRDDLDVRLARLGVRSWWRVKCLRQRGELLAAASSGDQAVVRAFLEGLGIADVDYPRR